jgi:hypothetical protein
MCRVVRGWSAIAGDPATGASARHLAACPSCRAYFAAATDLDTRLRRAAPQRTQALPEGFEQRMDRAIATVTREQRASRSPGSHFVLWSALAGATAVAAVAFMLVRTAEVPPASNEGQFVENPEAVLEDSVAVARNLNDRFWNDVAPTATTFVRENPLQQELGAVYSDARSALQFLALNFLPDSAQPDAPPAT